MRIALIIAAIFLALVALSGCLSREDLQGALDTARETQEQGQEMVDQAREWIEAAHIARETASSWIDEAMEIKAQAQRQLEEAEKRAEQLGIAVSDETRQRIDDLSAHADRLLAAGKKGVERSEELLVQGETVLDAGERVLNDVGPKIAELQHALDNHQPWWWIVGSAIVSAASLFFGGGGILAGVRGAKTIAAVAGAVEAVKPLLSTDQRQALGSALSATTDDDDKQRIARAKINGRGRAAQAIAERVLPTKPGTEADEGR